MRANIFRFLLASLACAISINARAFEVGEFKSGMPQVDALQRLRALGFKITQTPSYFVALRGRDTRTAGFCNSRLVTFSYTVPGGLRGFIRRVSELSNQYGQGTLDTFSSETEAGEVNSLTVRWLLGPDTLRVTYLAASGRSSESQTVLWSTRSECSDRAK